MIVLNLGPERIVDVIVAIRTVQGEKMAEKVFPSVTLPAGRTLTRLEPWRANFPVPGVYAVEYTVVEKLPRSYRR